MSRHLLCIVMDAGPAAYIKPVFESWLETPPPFSWSVRLGEKAAYVLGNLEGLKKHRGENLDRLAEAPVDEGDAVLVSAGGWPGEKAQIKSSRDHGVPTVQFVDSCYNYARRFCDGDNWTLPDRVLLITEKSVIEAASEGVPKSLCTVVGHPAWAALSPLPETDCEDILFVGAPVERDYGSKLGYTEIEAWQMLTKALDQPERSSGRLFYAKHPEQSPDAVPTGVTLVDYDASKLPSFGTIAGMFSAPLVDAYLSGRRAISVQPNAVGSDMFFLSRQGYLPRVTNYSALECALDAMPADPAPFALELEGSCNRVTKVLCEVMSA